MAMLLPLLVVVFLILIFGVSKENIFAGGTSLLGAFITGAMGIALLGTAIAFPPAAVAVVLFFIIRGLFR